MTNGFLIVRCTPGLKATEETRAMTKSLAGATVLVAEDDVVSLEIVSRMLPRLSIAEVLKAKDGVEAIEQIERAEGKVYAAILDFSMPRVHGLQVLRKIRADETSADAGLPCIMLTGHDDSGLHGLALALGANTFLRKPATFDKLKESLERITAESTPAATPDAYRQIDVEDSVEAILQRIALTRSEGEAIDRSVG
jgi:CheY-like chemotaxis protein